ncbi:MAG: hypothetical protein DRR19_03250 [Candidatus Parabeggiatoa sp. nov. 1]|nr:MAG: hypothetical protein DRR19_03250 [Gammaproteobacteria bacterium]
MQPGQQFVLYIQGHGLPEQLKITREYWLDASELRRLVDKVSPDVPQVIIIDSCYSGSFLDELRVSDELRPTVQRIVLTSTDADTTAWNALHESFSEKLISELRHGETLKTAFDRAESMMAFETKLFGEQRPQLDDDGDGVYTSQDGRRAHIILGNEGGRSADAPEIIDIHEPLFLDEQQTEGMLWVKTSPSGDGIRGVRAILMRPGTQRIDYQGEATEFNREEVAMSYLQDRYVAVYSQFRKAGTWRVLYQAQGEDGTWSSNRFGEVEASGDFSQVVVTARMNQSAYQIGDYLSFKVDLNAEINQPGPYDIYGAIVFPQGYFVTFAYPMTPSLPGVALPYRQAVEVSQPKTLSILDLDLPAGLDFGSYQACGVVTETGDDPMQSENWIDIDCAGFELR